MEIVGGGMVVHQNGGFYWDNSGGKPGYPAVADLDGDGAPDVVSVASAVHAVTAYKHDGTKLWGPVDVNNGVPTPQGASGGGPPTIADFDGDGKPDVATAGGYGYLVLHGATGKVMWQSTMTTDTSSRVTGSSVFDFDGDGSAEVLYNDEHDLRVFKGGTGQVLLKMCSTSGTLWEYPVVVDVDGDDHAEIIAVDNNYIIDRCDQALGGGLSHTGFKVIGDVPGRWLRTRRIWNQHAYHVTNINDDGTVPKDEPDNWSQAGLNNFRQNVQSKGLFAAPDLVVRDVHALLGRCMDRTVTIVATVINQGSATAPAGVSVAFVNETPMGRFVLRTPTTKTAILPGGGETLSVEWQFSMGIDPKGPFKMIIMVDSTGQPGTGVVNECNEDNNDNTGSPLVFGCPGIG
jgi:hypothetical protein